MADEATSLLELARSRAAQRDERLAALATELHGTPRGLLTDSDRSLMTGMLGTLVEAVATDLEARLETGPAGGARERAALGRLGLDAILLPLRRSGVLAEPAVIEAAWFRLLEFHLGVQARDRARTSSPPGAGAGTDVVARLLAQGDPAARQALTAFLVVQAKRLDPYGNPLLAPADLPRGSLASLYWAVAVVLDEVLGAENGRASSAREEAVEAATLDAVKVAASAGVAAEGEALAARLMAVGLVGPEMLAPLLAAGETALFAALFSGLSGVAPARLARFLFEPGGEALAICARAVGMARPDLEAILDATGQARQGPLATRNDEAAAALALYDGLAADAVTRLMRHWARSGDFLWMQRRIDQAGRGAPRLNLRARP